MKQFNYRQQQSLTNLLTTILLTFLALKQPSRLYSSENILLTNEEQINKGNYEQLHIMNGRKMSH